MYKFKYACLPHEYVYANHVAEECEYPKDDDEHTRPKVAGFDLDEVICCQISAFFTVQVAEDAHWYGLVRVDYPDVAVVEEDIVERKGSVFHASCRFHSCVRLTINKSRGSTSSFSKTPESIEKCFFFFRDSQRFLLARVVVAI